MTKRVPCPPAPGPLEGYAVHHQVASACLTESRLTAHHRAADRPCVVNTVNMERRPRAASQASWWSSYRGPAASRADRSFTLFGQSEHPLKIDQFMPSRMAPHGACKVGVL